MTRLVCGQLGVQISACSVVPAENLFMFTKLHVEIAKNAHIMGHLCTHARG